MNGKARHTMPQYNDGAPLARGRLSISQETCGRRASLVRHWQPGSNSAAGSVFPHSFPFPFHFSACPLSGHKRAFYYCLTTFGLHSIPISNKHPASIHNDDIFKNSCSFLGSPYFCHGSPVRPGQGVCWDKLLQRLGLLRELLSVHYLSLLACLSETNSAVDNLTNGDAM